MDKRSIQQKLLDSKLFYFVHDETPGDGACFYHAVCALLSEECYHSGTPDHVLSVSHDIYLFKVKLLEYIRGLDISNNDEWRELRESYLVVLRSDYKISSDFSDDVLWNVFLNEMSLPNAWAKDCMIMLTS